MLFQNSSVSKIFEDILGKEPYFSRQSSGIEIGFNLSLS